MTWTYLGAAAERCTGRVARDCAGIESGRLLAFGPNQYRLSQDRKARPPARKKQDLTPRKRRSNVGRGLH